MILHTYMRTLCAFLVLYWQLHFGIISKRCFGYWFKYISCNHENDVPSRCNLSNCEAVYFCGSKRSLKSRSDEHKRYVKNYDCDKNEIAKHVWEANHNFNWNQKKVIDRENRIKENIHSLKNPNPIDKTSYMLLEIWLPNLR